MLRPFVVVDGSLGDGPRHCFVRGLHDLAEGHARGVVDAGMDIYPVDVVAVALVLMVM